MLDKQSIIKKINKTCRIFFTESSFFLNPSSANRFVITGDKKSKARNNYSNQSEEIYVIKWFDCFWVYIEIRFENQNTLISLSVFQGEETDNIKHQLFRAEWDDYNNNEEKHPQPHWHITSNQAIEKTFKEIASIEDSDTFANLLIEEKSKIIDINKIHFAMIGNWINNETHIHSINSEEKVIKWFQGLLSHLKEQLEYVR